MGIRLEDLRRDCYRATRRRCYHNPHLALLAGVIWFAVRDQVAGNGNAPEVGFWHCPLFVFVLEQLGLDPDMVRVRVGVE